MSAVTLLMPQPVLLRMFPSEVPAHLNIAGVPAFIAQRAGDHRGHRQRHQRSMLTGGVAKLAEFPAVSVTVTLTVSPAPSPVMTTGLLLLVEATPDMTIRGGERKAHIAVVPARGIRRGRGRLRMSASVAWLLRLIVTDSVAVPPAEVAVQVNVMPDVSAATVLASHPSLLETGDGAAIGSVHAT